MNKNIFSLLLEFIWLIVGLVAGFASVNSFVHQDSKNGFMMALFSVIGFLMFFLRRSLRLRRKKEKL